MLYIHLNQSYRMSSLLIKFYKNITIKIVKINQSQRNICEYGYIKGPLWKITNKSDLIWGAIVYPVSGGTVTWGAGDRTRDDAKERERLLQSQSSVEALIEKVSTSEIGNKREWSIQLNNLSGRWVNREYQIRNWNSDS